MLMEQQVRLGLKDRLEHEVRQVPWGQMVQMGQQEMMGR